MVITVRLILKQKIFSWFDSYNIYGESGETLYVVKGQLAWGHCLKIFNPSGEELATVKQRVFTFLPKFDIYVGGVRVGLISKRFTLFRPVFDIDFNGWHVEGNFFEWDYNVRNSSGAVVAMVSKQIFNFSDTYVIEIANNSDALSALALVLAIDAEKCSRN